MSIIDSTEAERLALRTAAIQMERATQPFAEDGYLSPEDAALLDPFLEGVSSTMFSAGVDTGGGSAQELREDLADFTDASKGAGLLGLMRSPLSQAVRTAGNFLSAQMVNVWEFAYLISNKPNPANPETWDWYPAISAAYAYVAANYPQGGLRYGKAVYFPAMLYLTSQTVGPTRLGIATVGDGALTSVIAPFTGFTGAWVFKAQHSQANANMGGCSIFNMGIDCAGVATGGFDLEDGYDCLTIDNLRISRVHPDWVGARLGPRTDALAGQPLSQTVFVKQLFVYKNGGGATVPTVQLIKLQEAQFIGCKAWAGGFGGAGRGNTSAWYIEDSRSLDFLGCSAVGAQDFGVTVRAQTKTTDGIRFRGMLYENCNGTIKTSTSDAVNLPLKAFYHDLPRIEAPFTGIFDIGGVNGGFVDVGNVLATLQADSEQITVLAQRISNVTDSSTGSKRNYIMSHPNAIDNFVGFSKSLRVIATSTPRYTFGVPDLTDFGYVEWSRSIAANNGLRIGVNVAGTDVTLATLKEAPTANNTCLTLLVNDGTTTVAKQVSVGAADSGGAGFRMLRIPN